MTSRRFTRRLAVAAAMVALVAVGCSSDDAPDGADGTGENVAAAGLVVEAVTVSGEAHTVDASVTPQLLWMWAPT